MRDDLRALIAADRELPVTIALNQLDDATTLPPRVYTFALAIESDARTIALEDWQQSLVDEAPWAFLRGCIRSDGCAFLNRTGRYEYLSYAFSNLSVEILDLFEATCRALGMQPRRYVTAIRLNRRADAARMLEHVGLKS